jgi:hypothetical protein
VETSNKLIPSENGALIGWRQRLPPQSCWAGEVRDSERDTRRRRDERSSVIRELLLQLSNPIVDGESGVDALKQRRLTNFGKRGVRDVRGSNYHSCSGGCLLLLLCALVPELLHGVLEAG